MSKRLKLRIAFSVCLGLFLLPILVYIGEFGIGVWSEHTKWAEMGSAFSGIYSPFIALLAFIILFRQTKSQESVYKHQFDQAYIQDVRTDLNFYLARLDSYLDVQNHQEETPRSALARFSSISEDNLLNDESQMLARQFISKHRKVIDIWIALYPLLIGLSVNKKYPYDLCYSGSILKIATVLSMSSCVSLDQIYYLSNHGIKKDELIFWSN
ncbi:hypothetical protein [Methylophaga sp.]|uniref:hypothetical protein n=1 Tax=Methylophaga sp. TaxID=2024840 RepID=UPI003F69F39E